MTGHAVQIIKPLSKGGFKLMKKIIEAIYGDIRVANLPLILLCIAGAARKGKSFLLNFFLDFLVHTENNPDMPWKLDNDSELEGFKFRDGEDRTTVGIWAWDHVFVIEDSNGKKFAVSLIDSQGTFDRETRHEDCSTIFAMTCMFSSIMCFNVFSDLQEDKLNSLVVFINHAERINENLGGSGKLFQDLVFLVRDFQFMKYYKDKDGGQNYIKKVLGPCDKTELQTTRDTIKTSAENIHCFVFSHPGNKVTDEDTSEIGKIDPNFVSKAQDAVLNLLSNLSTHKKMIGASVMICGKMPEYMDLCLHTFDANQQFAPKAAQTVNREFMINLEEQRASNEYEKIMQNILKEHKTGCPEEYFKEMDKLHSTQIEEDISARIKNKDICKIIIKKFIQKRQNIFENLANQNKSVLEFEKQKMETEAKFAATEARIAASEDRFRREKEEQREKMEKLKKENEEIFAKNEAKFAETQFRNDKERDEFRAKIDQQKKEMQDSEAKMAASMDKKLQEIEKERQKEIEELKKQQREIEEKADKKEAQYKKEQDELKTELKNEMKERKEAQEELKRKLEEDKKEKPKESSESSSSGVDSFLNGFGRGMGEAFAHIIDKKL